MTISKTKAGGWSENQKLTSSQITAIDANIENSLDKRSGHSDTLESTITVNSNGSILVTGTGNKIVLNAAAKIVANASGSQILANASGSKIITANGAVFEIGGSTEFPQFTTSRSRSILFSHGDATYVNSWVDSGAGEDFISTNVGGVFTCDVPVHDGATISSIDMFYIIGSSHFPQYKLNLSCERFDVTTNIGSSLNSTFLQYVSGTNSSTYYNGGAVQTFNYVCNQNNVCDNTKYRFVAFIEEEYGTSSVAGNKILGFRVNFSDISTMKFA